MRWGNALIPVITVTGMGFCNLLGGMVFVEKIFAWPGIGQYAYLSATTLDFPAICGVSLLIAPDLLWSLTLYRHSVRGHQSSVRSQ